MKNFPHQYSQFPRVRRTLETIRDLNDAGDDVSDNDTLGYELTRRGINTLRGDTELPLEERIALRRAKRSSDQGPQTAAREMRRTLRYLGWLDDDWQLTEAGDAFLQTDTGSEEEIAAWQQALLDLELAEDDDVSHPVRILLRLVAERPIVARDGLELALEARDDSEDEYQRIAGLAALPRGERLGRLGVSEAKAADAVKILPSFAEQAQLIARGSLSAAYVLTEAGRAALGEGFTARAVELRPEVRATSRRRRARGAPRRLHRGDVTRPTSGDDAEWRSLSHEEQIAATRLRFERTSRHQDMVGRLVALLEENDVELYEDGSAYDLLRVPREPAAVTIFEAKTLETDELTQTRLAVGQLLSYEHLNVRPRWEGRDIRRAVVYERPVDEELAAFLQAIDIAAFALTEDGLTPLNDVARESGLA